MSPLLVFLYIVCDMLTDVTWKGEGKAEETQYRNIYVLLTGGEIMGKAA